MNPATPTGTGERIVAAGLWAALATAALPLAGTLQPGSFALAVLLLVPVCLVAAAGSAGAHALLRRSRAWRGGGALRACVLLEAPLLVTIAGGFLVNQVVVDSPLGRASRLGYGLTLALAALALVVAHRATRARTRRVGAEVALAVALAVDALVVAGLDVFGIYAGYDLIHRALLATTILGWSSAAYLGVHALRVRRWLIAGTAVVAAAGVWVIAADRPALYQQMVATPTPFARILLAARARLDVDGDGYSAWFGGGDCDDRDVRAFPLAPGRDCLGWHPGEPLPTPAPEVARLGSAPDVIVLVTIDAFRCGFGAGGAPALRDACPELTRLAREGFARLDARSNCPNTAPAMTALMLGDPLADARVDHPGHIALAERLARLGFASEVLVTYPHIVEHPRVRRSFGVVDTTLRSSTTSPYRGDALSARLLARAQAALAIPGQKTFLWAHYPDPHFPFKVDPGSPWKRASMADYAQLVRRTDASIGELARELARLPGGERIMLVVTADHGEEFGEHGHRYHGFTLHETAVRVPIVVWSPGGPRRHGGAELPHQLADLARYLTHAAAGRAVAGYDADVLLRTVDFDDQLGLVSDGWKLIYNRTRQLVQLYHLADDEDERHDLAASRPDVVLRLGRRLVAVHERARLGPAPE